MTDPRDLTHVCDTCRDQPGSDTAAAKGCTCARMDNHRGHRPGGYYITEGCPVHWPEAPAGDQEDA